VRASRAGDGREPMTPTIVSQAALPRQMERPSFQQERHKPGSLSSVGALERVLMRKTLERREGLLQRRDAQREARSASRSHHVCSGALVIEGGCGI
jgi:hypothetical protein